MLALPLVGKVIAGAEVFGSGGNLLDKLGLGFGPGKEWLNNEALRKQHFALLTELRQLNASATGELKEMLKEPLARGVKATHEGVSNWASELAWMQEQHTKIMYFKQVTDAGGQPIMAGKIFGLPSGLVAVGFIILVGSVFMALKK